MMNNNIFCTSDNYPPGVNWNWWILLYVFSGVSGTILFLFPHELALSFLLFLTLLFAGTLLTLTTSRSSYRSFICTIFLCGYIIRYIAAMFLYLYSLKLGHGGFLFDDDLHYDTEAWKITLDWIEGFGLHAPKLLNIYPGYYIYTAIIYRIFGHSILFVEVWNAFFGSLVIIYSFKITNSIFNTKIARTAALLTAFFPSLVLYSGVHLKDCLITFLITFSIWNILEIVEQKKFHRILLIVPTFYFLKSLRGPMAAFLLVCLGGYVCYKVCIRYLTSKRIKFIGFISTLLFLLALALMPRFNSIFIGYTEYAHFERLAHGSIYSAFSGASSPFIRMLLLPVFVVFTLLVPFPPWRFETLSGVLNMPGNLIWYILIPLAVVGILEILRQKNAPQLLVATVVILVIVANAYLFFGTAATFRYRSQMYPLFMILAAWGTNNFKRWVPLIHLYAYGFVAGCFLYIFLRQ